MNVNELLGAQRVATPSTGSNSEVSQDQFLQLFLQQIQAQDPLNPMEGDEFLSQLATFSQLEQLTQLNQGITGLSVGQAGIIAGQTVTMIGRDVIYEGNETHLRDGTSTLRFELPASATEARIEVRDTDGIVVRTIELDDLDAGSRIETWDGQSDGGAELADGTYTFDVVAVDGSGEELTVPTTSSGTVEGVTYRNGIPELIIGDVNRSPADIIEIN
jgi:flagellar basal-body rod modification protein FlgD